MELEHILRTSLYELPDYRSSYVPPRPGDVHANLNEGPDDLPAPLKDAVLARLRDLPLHRYPDPHARELIEKIARRERVAPECVALCNGVNDAVFRLLFMLHPESALIYTPPTYYLYERLARTVGLQLKPVPLGPGFRVKGGEVLVAAYEVFRCMAILADPNNPTGVEVDDEQMELVCGQFPGLIVIDEAYHDFSGRSQAHRLATHPGLVLLRTFSKAFSFAAGRAGYLLADPGFIRQFVKTGVPYALPATTQAVACALLDHADVVAERARQVRAERDRLAARLAAHPRLEPLPSAANFFLVRVRDGGDPRAILAGCAARGVHLRDVSHLPQLADCFRITVGTAADDDRIAAAVEEAASALPA